MNRFKLGIFGMFAATLIVAQKPAAAKNSPAVEMARQLNEAFIEVADEVMPAVVVIEVREKMAPENDQEDSPLDQLPPELRKWWENWGQQHGHDGRQRRHAEEGEGSGIVITSDGYILTNNHVVENADKITVRFKDGRQFDAVVKGTDPESDVAVIKIKAKNLVTAKLGDSDKTRVGEFAMAIGAPFEFSYTVTVGHISAKGRSFEGMAEGRYADQDFLQTDASINPGNSGGPLINLYGEVIGINTMIAGLNTGIGFAIPINLAKRVKDHLIAEGKFIRSWIGVEINDLRGDHEFQDLDKKLVPGLEDGVVVRAVEANGPAAKSSLQPSDVIVAVDGTPVKTARELKDIISTTHAGSVVALSVVRGNQQLTVKVETEALPSDIETAKSEQKPSGGSEASDLGLTVHSINKDLASQYNLDQTSGVVVTAVDGDSPAADQDIKAGDVITEVNRQPISSPHQFKQAIRSADAKRGIMINLIRDGTSMFVVLKDTPQ